MFFLNIDKEEKVNTFLIYKTSNSTDKCNSKLLLLYRILFCDSQCVDLYIYMIQYIQCDTNTIFLEFTLSFENKKILKNDNIHKIK